MIQDEAGLTEGTISKGTKEVQLSLDALLSLSSPVMPLNQTASWRKQH